MKIVLGSDHAGFQLKEAIKNYLLTKNLDVLDVGTNSLERADYPIYGAKAARAITNGDADIGILCCGSAEGISIAANKIKGIRCGIGYNDEVSHLIREHNNANMIAFAGRFMEVSDVLRRVDLFLNASFLGERHAIRVKQIEDLEE